MRPFSRIAARLFEFREAVAPRTSALGYAQYKRRGDWNCSMRAASRTLRVMKMVFVGLLVIAVSMRAAQDSQQAQMSPATNLAVPQFEHYKVNKIYKGKPAVPVLRTPDDREYRTRIREGAKAGPNFAGHYTLIIIGCGTECASFVIVDAANGRVFSRAQKEYTCGPDFKVDSRLLTTDVCTGAIQTGCTRAYWQWTGTELKFLTRLPIDCR